MGQARHLSDAAFVTLWPGDMIGRYEVMSLLGCGVLGPTYRARDPTLGRNVVIKEFLPWTLALRLDGTNVVAQPATLAPDLDFIRARFVEESMRLREIPPAPSVVRAIDLFDANGTSCAVFDLVSGISLDMRVRTGGALRPATVQRLVSALVEALAHLHDEGLLHGDIRPANVMLDLIGRPTLIGFANARAAMASRLPETAASLRVPGYAAPELVRGEKPDTATDIYALAATIYYAITGRAPPDAVERLRADRYEPLIGLAPAGLARELLAGIDRALALHPGDRPQTISVLRALLRPRAPARPPAWKALSIRLWTAAAAAVLVAVPSSSIEPPASPAPQPSRSADAQADGAQMNGAGQRVHEP
ncbi:serine/threonine-protein kinase [Reyranella sp.]|jgi:serine/threonine protein kinase|uniref:serine/threonine-protein kinase n=1 Tax=Reyranella sp. TaxID=1929291 RepID=UPI002F94DADE